MQHAPAIQIRRTRLADDIGMGVDDLVAASVVVQEFFMRPCFQHGPAEYGHFNWESVLSKKPECGLAPQGLARRR